MYLSPITDRIRKRKAFADSELDSNTNHLSMTIPQEVTSALSIIQVPTVTNTITFPSHSPSIYSIPSSYLHHSPQNRIAPNTNEMEFNHFLQPNPLQNYYNAEYHCYSNTNIRSKIKIIEDVKLFDYSNGQLRSSPVASEEFSQIKPKLSFSIESIIGIK